LAVAIQGDGIVEIFNFSTETGQLSGSITLEGTILQGAFGLEFSPEGDFLYLTATGLQGSNEDNNLLQFDLTLPDQASILSSVVTLNPESEYLQDVEGLQLTTNRRILVSRAGKEYLGVIENPDRPDTLCNYNEDAVPLEANLITNGLTNFASHYLDIPPFTWDTKCHGDETYFNITNDKNIENINWDFNDPAGESDLSDPYNPYHIFSEPGDYEVTLTLLADGQPYDYNQTVTIHPLPVPDLGRNRYVFPGSSIVLTPGNFYSYEWEQPASADSSVRVSESGTYAVTVEDEHCCTSSDAVEVIFVPLKVPTAIRPQSGHAENRVFRVAGTIEGLSDFQMQIFNRWGQLLFNTTDRNEGWDGTYQGERVQKGAYTYIIRFVITDDELNERNISKSGTVTVVR
jgi:gliding motility-associated-like protein